MECWHSHASDVSYIIRNISLGCEENYRLTLENEIPLLTEQSIRTLISLSINGRIFQFRVLDCYSLDYSERSIEKVVGEESDYEDKSG